MPETLTISCRNRGKENSKLLQLKIENNNIPELDSSNILFIIERTYFYPPIQNLVIKAGDVIVLAATRKSLEGVAKLDEQLRPQLTRFKWRFS